MPFPSLLSIPKLLLVCAVALLFSLTPHQASWGGEEVHRHEVNGFPGCYVKVESIFGLTARQGSLPFRITFQNQSGADRSCSVKFVIADTNYGQGKIESSSSYRLTAKNNATMVRDVYVAVVPSFTSSGYVQIRFQSEIINLSPVKQDYRSVQTDTEFPTLAISSDLARRNLTALNDVVKKATGSGEFATSFLPDELPTDWQGYSSLDALLIDLPAWKAITELQRQTMLSWVRLGGRLDLYMDPGRSDLGAVPVSLNGIQFKDDHARLGLGEIYLQKYPIDNLPTSSIFDLYKTLPRAITALAEDYNDPSLDSDNSRSWSPEAAQDATSGGSLWPLLDEINVEQKSPVLAMIFLVLFAILVAPVNLYFFAGKERRQRLFITTPLISLTACLAITASIFLLDGIGGHGVRVVLADLQPGPKETHIYTTQEQLSRTGVMLATGFTRKQEYSINLLRLPNVPLNPFSDGRTEESSFSISGNRCDGPFFRSRSIQGYSLRALRSDRARIEQSGTENDMPVLVSALSTEIVEFYYIDSSSKAWAMPSGSAVGSGARIPLAKADDRLPPWVTDIIDQFGKTNRDRIRQMVEPNRFYAKASNPESFVLTTHPGITWRRTDLLLTGSTVLPSSSTSTTPPTQP